MTAPPVRPNTAPALIRTITPLVVGAALAWLASRGLDLTQYGNAVNVYLVPLLGGIYYAAVLKAEKRWPALGWLLLYARQPQYDVPVGEHRRDPDGHVRIVERADLGTRLHRPGEPPD